jgi:TolB protein
LKYILAVLTTLLSLHATSACAQQGYLEVSAPGNRQLQLAVAQPTALSGALPADVSRQIVEIFTFDLSLVGLFSVTSPAVAEGKAGIKLGEFDFSPWVATGADLLLKSTCSLSGGTLILEGRLFDLAGKRQITAKRFTGPLKELRWMAHAFADEVMRAVTGESGPFTGKIAFVSRSSGNKEVALMDYDGHNVQRVTNNGAINLNPDFSPVGKEIIYTSYKKGNPDLFRRELFTGTEARISSRQGINIAGAYAPDGKRIAVALSKDGNSEIYLIDKEGKELARLTRNPGIDVSPAWSPDGKKIAFVSDRLGKPQVFVMDADGQNVRRLTSSGSYNVSPRWSPKGDRILYCRQSGGGFQIYVINPDGGDDTQLTREGSNEHPRWSPDGRFIVFSSNRAGGEAIYVMRADGSGQTKVSRGKSKDSHPVWSTPW